MSPLEKSGFETHLASCAHCRAAVETTGRLIGRLRSIPAREVSRDLAPLILAMVKGEGTPRRMPVRWWRIAAAAAAISALVGGALMNAFRSPDSNPAESPNVNTVSAGRALDWFCHHQEADGSWNAEKWGGNSRFKVALTALPLIALLEGERNAQRDAAAERATAYVVAQQNPDGTFGEPFREAPYNQSVSTLALLRAYERKPGEALRRSIDASLRHLLASQTSQGGWGYQNSPLANFPITLWHKEVLEAAVALGWEEVRPAIPRVSAWLASQPSPPALHEESFRQDATDYHRAYFAVSSLRQSNAPGAHEQLTAIRKALVAMQAGSGDESGTWSPSDQWGRAGGRIYSTALASLALR